ncbi:hypothetical protein ABZ478_14880 [Streptomyces sp. NPDC005706]|uniref:hypothetical protein n=1 Tax=Streptomyces sp. NPDC005706 TaxID=3157169 RepID=UPI0033DCB41A
MRRPPYSTAPTIKVRTTPGWQYHHASGTHPAQRPEAQPPETRRRPVFIDQSGRRRRLMQLVSLSVGLACSGYLLFVGTLVGGLMEPMGSAPPRTHVPGPGGHGTPGPTDGPARAHRPSPAPDPGHHDVAQRRAPRLRAEGGGIPR